MGKNRKYHQFDSLDNSVPIIKYHTEIIRDACVGKRLLGEGGSEIKTALLYSTQMWHITQRGDRIQILRAPKESC